MTALNPKIVVEPARKLVGLEFVGKPGGDEIPKLWQEFMPRMSEVKRLKDTFGASKMLPGGGGEIAYLVGSEVADFLGMPAGMTGWNVVGGLYAVLACPSLQDLGGMIDEFYNRWLPASSYLPGEGMLEYYPPTFPNLPHFELRFALLPKQ